MWASAPTGVFATSPTNPDFAYSKPPARSFGTRRRLFFPLLCTNLLSIVLSDSPGSDQKGQQSKPRGQRIGMPGCVN